ncbi:MAG: hypothetical protein ACKKL6_03600 [Candidatus Komeilibacteria bacterium]
MKSKFCAFCRAKINFTEEVCPNCRQILIEKIALNESFSETESYGAKKEYDLKLISKRIVFVLVGILFFSWIISDDDTIYGGGVKAPLPLPAQQDYDGDVETGSVVLPASLANGTILKKNDNYFQGDGGTLYIDNGTSLDAVAKLITDGVSVFTVYIKSESEYTITGISDGVYWLAFAQGLDYNSDSKGFNRSQQYSVFDETFDYQTTSDREYYYFSGFEVTLYPVVGGNAETSNVDSSQFDLY